jgi:LAS superfamily LD-carboxypeptidase LdcB
VTPAELTGRARTHIADLADPLCALHAGVVVPFLNLRRAALADGFDLVPVSGFRDFARQLAIWNSKFSGAAPLYDASGSALDAARLSPPERIGAIVQWSAIPGASRHHWGTDIDLIDRSAISPEYRVQLVAAEFAPPGPFAPLAQWLEINAAQFGFFRPFRGVLSGVQPEPWHFSFAPIAEQARRALTPALLRAALDQAPLLGKEHVLERLDELHARYVASIDWP